MSALCKPYTNRTIFDQLGRGMQRGNQVYSMKPSKWYTNRNVNARSAFTHNHKIAIDLHRLVVCYEILVFTLVIGIDKNEPFSLDHSSIKSIPSAFRFFLLHTLEIKFENSNWNLFFVRAIFQYSQFKLVYAIRMTNVGSEIYFWNRTHSHRRNRRIYVERRLNKFHILTASN